MRIFLIVATVLAAVSTPTYASPEIHVRVANVSDAAEHAAHVELVKRSLRDLNVHAIDVVVTKLAVAANGQVSAKIDVVLSNAGGMRSMASGSAAFVAPKRQLRDACGLRREVLAHALQAVRKRFKTTRPVS
ncbi:MAG: hypothetical protein M4D80_25230 [Myxococcota bacterium]|nr:hypothetical protein [Myxococcota bacterium]